MAGCIDETTVGELFRGALTSGATEELHGHLAACSSCRELVSMVARSSWAQRASASASANAASHERSGRIGRYLLIDYLGAGAMGVVYAAYDTHLDRRVALKLLKLRSGDGNARLQREAQAMARISHPNVAQVYDAAEIDGELVVAMELVEGVTLRDWLTQRRERGAILACLCAAGDGLAAVHDAGVVHGDFKPENVLVGKYGRVRVTDFGLACASVADASLAGAGTPGYAAPEVLAGQAPDARSDQFSFCVTLFEALHGELPFAAGSLAEWRDAVDRGELRTADKSRRQSRALRETLERGLRARADDRHPSLAALLSRLRAEPRARRRRRIYASAALALFLIATTVGLVGLRPRLACRHAAAEADGIWDAPRRDSITAAFVSAHPTLARSITQRVLAALDGHIARWRTASVGACRDRVRGEPSEITNARRQCLAEDFAATAALVEQLAHADRGAVERASEAVASLDEPERCSSARVLAYAVRLPVSADARTRASAARLQLARARGVAAAGRLGDAVALARTTVTTAHAVGAETVEAEALCQVAELDEQLADYKASRTATVDALRLAEAVDLDRVAARAFRLLAVLDGTHDARFSDGHTWVRLAEARLTRLADADRLRIDLDASEATILITENRLPEAIERLQQAVKLARLRDGERSALVGKMSVHLAQVLVRVERFAEAEREAQRALDVARALYGDAHPDAVFALQILAQAAHQQGHFSAAQERYEAALAAATTVFGPDNLNVVRIRQQRAFVLMQLGQFKSATEELQGVLAAQTRAQAPDLEIAVSQLLLGQALGELGRADEAVAALQRSADLFRHRLGENHPQYASALAAEAVALLMRGQPAAARPLVERAIAIRRATVGAQSADLGQDYRVLGQICWRLGDAAAAADVMERSAEVGFGTHDRGERAEAQFLLARALWTSGRDRRRALTVAESASALYAQLGDSARAKRETVDDWLTRHTNGSR